MYIKREAQILMDQILKQPKVLLILGARQIGKTTMVKHVLAGKNVLFFNLDIESDWTRLEAVASLPPKDALLALGDPDFLVIDEAQRKTETSRIVKGWFDAGLSNKIILLGSSSLNLLNQTAESLTGRNDKIFLPPLLFREVVSAQSWYSSEFSYKQIAEKFSSQVQTLLLQSMVFGNYPESVTSKDKQGFLLNLSSDYLMKDVLQMGLVKDPNLLRKLLMLLAFQTGSMVSVNELAVKAGISRATVERYLDLLERTFVIFRLFAYSTNPRKEISKSQKIFFWDTGIRNALINNFSETALRSDIGQLWENWVVAEFAKQNILSGNRKNLYFWRSRAGSEVDLVVKEGSLLEAYEIKWSRSQADTRAFSNQYSVKPRIINHEDPFVEL